MGTAPAAHAGPAGTQTVAQLHLITLTCLNQNDYFGSDEPYLKVNGVRIWSGSNVDPFDTEWVDYWYTFDEVVRVELWEDDGGWTGDDDWMATWYMWAGEAGTGVHEIWTNTGPGRYELRYEVV